MEEERKNLYKSDFSLNEIKEIRELEKLSLRKKKINNFLMEKRNIINLNNKENNFLLNNEKENKFELIKNGRILYFLSESIIEKDENKISFYITLIFQYFKEYETKSFEKNILLNFTEPNSLSNLLIEITLSSNNIPILYFSTLNLVQLTFYSNKLCDELKNNISLLNHIINKFMTYFSEEYPLLSNLYIIIGNLLNNQNDYLLLRKSNCFISLFKSIKLFNTEDKSNENLSYLENLLWLLKKFLDQNNEKEINYKENLIESIPKLIKIIRMFYYSNEVNLLFQLLETIYILTTYDMKIIEIIYESGIVSNIYNLFEYLFYENPEKENPIILDCDCVNECLKIYINIFSIEDSNILKIYYNNELSLVINKLVYKYRFYKNNDCNIQDSIINLLFNLACFPEVITIDNILEDEKMLSLIIKYYSKNNIYKTLIFFDNIINLHPTLTEKCIDLNLFDVIILGLNEEFFGNQKFDILKMEFQILFRLINLDLNSKNKKIIRNEFENRNIKELLEKIVLNEKNKEMNLLFEQFIKIYEEQFK